MFIGAGLSPLMNMSVALLCFTITIDRIDKITQLSVLILSDLKP